MSRRSWTGDKRIDRYLADLPPFSHAICGKLREIIHQADAEITEDWKWGPNFAHKGMVCGLGAFKEWVTLTFFRGSQLTDRYGLFNDGLKNANNRSIRFIDVTQINAQKIRTYVKEAVKLNLSGIKAVAPTRRTSPTALPRPIAQRLAALRLDEIFKARPLYQKRDYIRWIEGAKQSQTQEKRIITMIRDLQVGTYMKMKYQ